MALAFFGAWGRVAAADPPPGLPWSVVGDGMDENGVYCGRGRLIWQDAIPGYQGSCTRVVVTLSWDGAGNLTPAFVDAMTGHYYGGFAIPAGQVFDGSAQITQFAGGYAFSPFECDFGSSWQPYRIFVLVMSGFCGGAVFHWSFGAVGWFFRWMRYAFGQFFA